MGFLETTFGANPSCVRSAEQSAKEVRNVFCVGRNFAQHARELGNDVPKSPMIFGKSTHAVVPAEGKVELPKHRSNIHHELEVVLWFDAPYQEGRTVSQMVSSVGLGLDLTDRDAQTELKAAGHPWEYSKAFRNSAVVTGFYEVKDWDALSQTPFALKINGKVVQQGVLQNLIFPLQTLVDYVGKHFYLDSGDILFTGTPAGVGPINAGDSVQLLFDDRVFGEFNVLE